MGLSVQGADADLEEDSLLEESDSQVLFNLDGKGDWVPLNPARQRNHMAVE
jgi:hypothetical protein